jgi:hypothetical protein
MDRGDVGGRGGAKPDRDAPSRTRMDRSDTGIAVNPEMVGARPAGRAPSAGDACGVTIPAITARAPRRVAFPRQRSAAFS